MRAFHAWHDAAIGVGLPDRPARHGRGRHRPARAVRQAHVLGRHAGSVWSAVGYDRIAQVVAVRHGLVIGVAFGFTHGAIVEIEAVRGRRLRRSSESVDEHLTDAPRRPTFAHEPTIDVGESVQDSVGHDDFGLQIPGFRHAGTPDAEMFDRTLAARAAGEESGFSSVWVMDHFWQLPALGGPGRTDPRGVHAARRARGAHRARAARDARHRRHLPQSGAAREDGHDPRRDLARAGDPRDRRGVVRRRARRLRLRLSRRRRTARPARGSGADLPRDVPRRTADVRRALLHDRRRAQRAQAAAGRRTADHDRRERREAHPAPRRAVRRHVQRERWSGNGAPQARRPARALRRRRPRPGGDHDDPARHARAHRRRRRDGTGPRVPVGPGGRRVRRAVHRRRSRRRRARGRGAARGGYRLPDLQHAALRPGDRRARPASCSRRTSRSLHRS